MPILNMVDSNLFKIENRHGFEEPFLFDSETHGCKFMLPIGQVAERQDAFNVCILYSEYLDFKPNFVNKLCPLFHYV